MSIETEIRRIETNIANAYTKAETKGATLPSVQNSENLAGTIDAIPQSSGGWQPEPDWFDIKTILEEDTEDYPAKMIILLTDGLDEMTFTMNASNHITKIKTSDGAEYTQTATHSWDTSKDKKCSLGYKTRYYIVYFNNTSATIRYDELPLANNFSMLYMILENLDLTVGATVGYKSWLQNHRLLESIKFINSTLTEHNGCLLEGSSYLGEVDTSKIYINNKGRRCFYGCSNLQNINGLNINKNLNSFDDMFFNCSKLKYVNIELCGENAYSFHMTFYGCSSLQRIKKIDFSKATDVNSMFYACSQLRVIDEILNIKINGINISPCTKLNYDTLMRFLDALHDYSSDMESTHTIVFGATNLAKLTEEEIAVGTNKGWTIS